MFHKNANLAGLDGQGLCEPSLLRRLRLEDHSFKAYLGFRVNSGQLWGNLVNLCLKKMREDSEHAPNISRAIDAILRTKADASNRLLTKDRMCGGVGSPCTT